MEINPTGDRDFHELGSYGIGTPDQYINIKLISISENQIMTIL